MANAIVKINKRAKQIQKAHPKKAWMACIQQASREYRTGKIGAYKVIEKKEKKSTPAKKVVRVIRTKKGMFKGTKKVAGTTREQIENKLGNAMVRHFKTQSIKETKRLDKVIAGYKKQLKNL